jgi:hypothetical protein
MILSLSIAREDEVTGVLALSLEDMCGFHLRA